MTTSPRDRAAAVAEKVASEHGEEWATCECGLGPHAVFTGCDCGVGCPESAYEAHLAAALADALVAEGLVGDGEALAQAWDKGYDDGMEEVYFEMRGMSSDSDAHTFPRRNPYREVTP